MTKSLSDLYDVFASLKPLRDRGVLFMGSGNIVHNLREMDFMNSKPFDWALEFDDLSKKIIENQDKSLLVNPFKSGLAARHAIPTDDHYRPLVAMMALMDKNEQPEFFNEAIDLGSVSMRSFKTSI
jgi:4,5-DOPA dioxygenase extradiol